MIAGARVNFEVEVQGVRPEKVVLHHSSDGGKFYAVKDLAPGKNMYDPWQVSMSNVQQDLDYYFTGGDAESRHYRLEVKAAPTIVAITHDLKFPAYVKAEDRKGIEGGEVNAIEGTEVTVHAQANMPASHATINFGSQDLSPLEMTISSQDPTQLTGTFTVTKSGTYQVIFRTTKATASRSTLAR